MKSRIISTGHYLPEKILTNSELEKMVDTTEQWITQRTGIHERRIARADEASSDMGSAAAKVALKNAQISPESIDAVICSTITPDHFFPSTAAIIQKNLNLKNAFAFDISAACSGFIYALSVADSLLKSGAASTVLVVATEKMSSITDWTDRSTCVLFGDGAGAAILKRTDDDKGILSTFMMTDGSMGDLLIVPAGGSRMPVSPETLENKSHFLKMAGNEVFKVAVRRMLESSSRVMKEAGLKNNDITLLIPHQANLRIIDAISKRIGLREDQVYINLDKRGNTSAASIAISLSEALDKKLITDGDNVILVSFGAGFTWGGIALRW